MLSIWWLLNKLASLTITYFAERTTLPVPYPISSAFAIPDWIAVEMEMARIEGGRVLIISDEGDIVELKVKSAAIL